MRSPISRAVTAAFALAVVASAAPAHVAAQDAEAPPAVVYRQGIMQGIRTHSGGLRAILGGEVPYEHVVYQARMLNTLAQMLGDVFPAGSTHEESRALPAIWENPDGFAERVSAIQSAAAGLLEAAEGGDRAAVGEAVQGLMGTCRGCHTDFRAR